MCVCVFVDQPSFLIGNSVLCVCVFAFVIVLCLGLSCCLCFVCVHMSTYIWFVVFLFVCVLFVGRCFFVCFFVCVFFGVVF